jgi:hypothetical protein
VEYGLLLLEWPSSIEACYGITPWKKPQGEEPQTFGIYETVMVETGGSRLLYELIVTVGFRFKTKGDDIMLTKCATLLVLMAAVAFVTAPCIAEAA